MKEAKTITNERPPSRLLRLIIWSLSLKTRPSEVLKRIIVVVCPTLALFAGFPSFDWASPLCYKSQAAKPAPEVNESTADEKIDWSVFLPEGEGRTLIVISCSGCHDLTQVIAQKKTKIGWRTSVQRMVSMYQTPLDKQDIPSIITYLASNFGENNPIKQLPMNINTDPAEALARLPGINMNLANAIVESRKTDGEFSAIEDILRVEKIDAKVLENIRRYITTKK